MPVDAALVRKWVTARSVARDLPPPTPDRGGLRVDTNSAAETCRWIFPAKTVGLRELADEIVSPGYLLKLCGTEGEMRGELPARWSFQERRYLMLCERPSYPAVELPAGYRLDFTQSGNTARARILSPAGELAASGYSAEAAGAFIFDRIETARQHRRRGLATALMARLEQACASTGAKRVLVATEDGRKLYASLGWTIVSPYTTAAIDG